MLLGKNCGRDKNCHLLIIRYSLEGGPEGNFRLPVSYVPAQKSIHRPYRLHVLFYFDHGTDLIGGFFVRERLFKLYLPVGIGRKFDPLDRSPLCLQFQKVDRYSFGALFGPFLGELP